jgi:hypothetical protein
VGEACLIPTCEGHATRDTCLFPYAWAPGVEENRKAIRFPAAPLNSETRASKWWPTPRHALPTLWPAQSALQWDHRLEPPHTYSCCPGGEEAKAGSVEQGPKLLEAQFGGEDRAGPRGSCPLPGGSSTG